MSKDLPAVKADKPEIKLAEAPPAKEKEKAADDKPVKDDHAAFNCMSRGSWGKK